MFMSRRLPRWIWLSLLTILFLQGCNLNLTPTPTPAETSPISDRAPTYETTIFDINVDQPATAARLGDSRPNIIVILTDDQPPSTLEYMPTVKSELMDKGVVFQQGFVTTPLCCPSRASILCGEYAHNHEVFTNRYPLGGALQFKDQSTIATWVKEAGYQTAYFGKYLNYYEDLKPRGVVPPGWDTWDVFLSKSDSQYYYNFTMSENGKEVEYPKSKANFSADVLTRKAVDYINTNRNAPFMMFLAYYNPHSTYLSAPRHKDEFRAGSAEDWVPLRPPNFNEADISDKPAYLNQIHPTDPVKIDASHKQILRSLLSVDDGVASVLNALKKTGLSDNTILIYLSDNGLTLGEHRFGLDKDCAYDECSHIPYVIYGPKNFTARLDATHLVANIDIAPTIAEWAGAKIPPEVNGASLVPLLQNPQTPWRDELLIEHWPDADLTESAVGSIIPEYFAIRTQEWKYVEYTTGEKELYNLKTDPYELENLASAAEYASLQADLAKRLQALKKQ